MAVAFVTYASGRVYKEKFYGEVHYVRGKADGKDGSVGMTVATAQCNDSGLVEEIKKKCPAFYDLDTDAKVDFGQPRLFVLSADYLGGEAFFGFTPLGISPRPAVKS